MVMGAVVVLVIGAMLINYLRGLNNSTENTTASEIVSSNEPEKGETPKLEDLPKKYTIQKGDNLWKVAEAVYGSGYNWIDIAKENNLSNPSALNAGQEINIPKVEARQATIVASSKTSQTPVKTIEGDTYTIAKGDSLWDIAVRAYQDGYKWVEIAKANDLENPGIIHPGNSLKLPR